MQRSLVVQVKHYSYIEVTSSNKNVKLLDMYANEMIFNVP